MTFTILNANQAQAQSLGVSQFVSVPAPTGGWNTRDSLVLMESSDAVELENFFPGQGYIETRKGYEEFITGLTGQVESLIEFTAGTTNKFLCANDDEINDITTGSVVNLGTGFSNARWQYVNFNSYLLAVNGSDTPQVYDGSSLSASTINGSGLVPEELDGINIYRNRVYVWDTESQDVWYGATNAIGGTFTKFQLSRVAPKGGNLVSMVNWNLDGSTSVSSYALFFMSKGDVLVYEGSDPGSDFALVGTYKIGAPLSVRGSEKIAGDVILMTDNDFVFFNKVFKNEGAVTSRSKLSGAILTAIQNYKGNFGFEVINYPQGGYLLFNIPLVTNNTYNQYIINTVTGASCKFTGWNGNTFSLFNSDLYFGGNGAVYKANTGFDDNDSEINCFVRGAYVDFQTSQEKRVNYFINTIKSDGETDITATVNFDYGEREIEEEAIVTRVGSYWDVSYWDVALWSPENVIDRTKIYSSGQGTAISMGLRIGIKGQQLKWYRTDYNITLTNNI